MAVVFKWQILTKTKEYEIFCSLKCTHDLIAHRGQQHANNRRSVQCTEDDNDGLINTKRWKMPTYVTSGTHEANSHKVHNILCILGYTITGAQTPGTRTYIQYQ